MANLEIKTDLKFDLKNKIKQIVVLLL